MTMPCRHSGKEADRLHDEAYRMQDGPTTTTTHAADKFLSDNARFYDEFAEFLVDGYETAIGFQTRLHTLNERRVSEDAKGYTQAAEELADWILHRIDKYVGTE